MGIFLLICVPLCVLLFNVCWAGELWYKEGGVDTTNTKRELPAQVEEHSSLWES